MTDNSCLTISVHELKALRDSNPDLCLIDVRELSERALIHIPGSLHIPKEELPKALSDNILDKEKIIYIHCKSGVRSLYAAGYLKEMGFEKVYSVEGGIMEWASFGYPVNCQDVVAL